MNKILTGALAALTLGGTVLGGASTASAREWDHHHDNGGAAVAAGIAGLAVGAALASSNNGYDRGYYDRGYYAPQPAYSYAPEPTYYQGPVYYSSYRNCRVQWRWDRRWGRYERGRACY